MNGVFLGLMNRQFSVYRIERTSNNAGGWPETEASLGVITGRLRPITAKEKVVANSEDRETTHILYVPYSNPKAGELDGNEIKRGDLVLYGDLKIEVLGVRDPSLAHEHLEIDCVQMEGLK